MYYFQKRARADGIMQFILLCFCFFIISFYYYFKSDKANLIYDVINTNCFSFIILVNNQIFHDICLPVS